MRRPLREVRIDGVQDWRGIGDGRRKSEDDVRALLDHGPYLPRVAVAAGRLGCLPRTASYNQDQGHGRRPGKE